METFLRNAVQFLRVCVPLWLVRMALDRWAGGTTWGNALSLWVMFGAFPLVVWRITEARWHETEQPPRPMPPGFSIVAWLVVFSTGGTFTIPGLMSIVFGLGIAAWECFVVAAMITLEWSRPWAGRAVLIAAAGDLVLTGPSLYAMLAGDSQPAGFPATVIGIGVVLHGVRALGLLAMLALVRGRSMAERAPVPAV